MANLFHSNSIPDHDIATNFAYATTAQLLSYVQKNVVSSSLEFGREQN